MAGFNNVAPFEIIAAPFTLWVAPLGTAFPVVNVAPAVAWVMVGTSGPLNYFESGVTVGHPQTITKWRSLGDSAPRKMFRTEEELIISLILADLTLEQYALALNFNTVTTTAPGAGAGYKTVGLSRGDTVVNRALLICGPSPYGDDFTMQYEVPIAFATGSPEVVYRRTEPAGLALEFTAGVDAAAATPDERFGRLRAQHALPV